MNHQLFCMLPNLKTCKFDAKITKNNTFLLRKKSNVDS